MGNAQRLSQLDGIRGLAILLVLIWHYYCCQIIPEPQSALAYLDRAFGLAWSGVDLFFVLSGFLITGILLDNRHSGNYFRIFYIRRMCRIMPVYYLVIALYFLVANWDVWQKDHFAWLMANPFPLWSYTTFTQNILMGMRGDFGPHWLGATWSLAIEEQFYLIIPLMVFLLPRRILFPTFIAAVLLAPLLRYLYPGFLTFVNTPWRSDSLLSGGCLAIMVRYPPFLNMVRDHMKSFIALGILLLLGAAMLTKSPESMGVFDHLWLAGLYTTFILAAYANLFPPLTRLLQNHGLVWFGQRSYGIYMYHEVVSGLLHGWIRHHPPKISSIEDAYVTATALLVTLATAALSYRYFETPILRFGYRFNYGSVTKHGGIPVSTSDGRA